VATTTLGGTAIRTPSKHCPIRFLCSKFRRKASPRAFPPRETPANPQKRTFRRLEGRRVEIAYQNLALLVSILCDRVDQVAPQVLVAREIDTLRGRSFCANANSVLAINQWERWFLWPW